VPERVFPPKEQKRGKIQKNLKKNETSFVARKQRGKKEETFLNTISLCQRQEYTRARKRTTTKTKRKKFCASESEREESFWFSFEEEEAQRRRICCLFFFVRFYDENHVDARKSPKFSREI
jgi:hypothetical protein